MSAVSKEALRPVLGLALALSIALYVLLGPLLLPFGLAGLVAFQLLVYTTPALWLARKQPFRNALLGTLAPSRWWLIGVLLGLGASVWNSQWSMELSSQLFRTSQSDSAFLSHFPADSSLPLLLLVFALVPAFCEELLHRGLVYRLLKNQSAAWVTILASALFFAASHLSLVRFLPLVLLGIVLAWLRTASKALAPSILCHLSYNAALLMLAAFELQTSPWLPVCAILSSGFVVFVAVKGQKETHLKA